MASEVAAAANLAMAIAAMIATGEGTRMKIQEAKGDYAREIARLEEAKNLKLQINANEMERTKEEGITALTERGAQGAFDTRMALMKVEQAASAGESRIGAGNIRATGTALAAQQQNVDIAYAGAQRQAQSAATGMKLGGLQLRSALQEGSETRSLLTMEYEQNLAEQRSKLAELKRNENAMIAIAYAGGLAGVTSSFYQTTNTRLWDWTKKKTQPGYAKDSPAAQYEGVGDPTAATRMYMGGL